MSESFDLGEPTLPASGQPYRVLARKYRPQRFSELIGQDAMVTTLGNAIRRGRLAHAFLMTGVRGVGKTSTARLIAKALNCVGPDGNGGPTIDPCGQCEPCIAIAEGRHIDVVEMDAASNTGVDDVREIIEAVRYAAVSARYKVYIIDEVHMLSKNAFNALLKTLEEPPPHVKFLFATTEVNKVPVTVLSRCQRFDLRRISADTLSSHFAAILDAEGVQAEPEAISLIARAAEGSARDGLSILDQAIAHASLDGEGEVTAAQVRDMLGLSDRGAIRELFARLLAGEPIAVINAIRQQHDLGVEPVAVMRGLLDLTHGVTLAKVGAPADPGQSTEERDALSQWASSLNFTLLHRLWQLLLKGHDEVSRAVNPAETAEMALLRLVHASSLPDPGDIIRRLESGNMPIANSGPALGQSQTTAQVTGKAIPADFEGLVEMLASGGKPLLAQQLHDFTGLVRYAPPTLEIRIMRPLPGEFARDLAQALKILTGQSWQVILSEAEAVPSLLEQARIREEQAREAIMAEPMIIAALAAFPGAELVDYEQFEQRSVSI